MLSKKYLHDKLILLLASVNVFLAFLCAVLVILRLGSGQGGYIVQYRANLGISAFKTGSLSGLLEFIAFAAVVVIGNLALSMRAYLIRRELSVVILSLGALLLVLAIIVSNALLVLR